MSQQSAQYQHDHDAPADTLTGPEEDRLSSFLSRAAALVKAIPYAFGDVTAELRGDEISAEWEAEIDLDNGAACIVVRFTTIGDDPQEEVGKQVRRAALKAQAALLEFAERVEGVQ